MDDRIGRELRGRLEETRLVNLASLEIRVRNGVVTLTGECEEPALRRMIGFVAESTEGVLGVENRIRLPRRGGSVSNG